MEIPRRVLTQRLVLCAPQNATRTACFHKRCRVVVRKKCRRVYMLLKAFGSGERVLTVDSRHWTETHRIFKRRNDDRCIQDLEIETSLGWTSAVTCLQHLQGVPRTCSFGVFTSYTYIDFARLITHQIVFHMKCNLGSKYRTVLLCGWQFLLNFLSFCFNM